MSDEQTKAIIAEALKFYLELAGHFEDYGKRDQAIEALNKINHEHIQ
jgi:hypothetical protein